MSNGAVDRGYLGALYVAADWKVRLFVFPDIL